MKMFVSAVALVVASPALAQTAPAQPHQGHAQHQQHGQPAQHQQQGQHQQHGQGHGEHQPGRHCACCADRNNDGRMDCCERHQSESGHQGH